MTWHGRGMTWPPHSLPSCPPAPSCSLLLPMRTVPISKNEEALLLKALYEGIRMDGRRPLDMRRVHLRFGKEKGHVEVQVGRTRVTTVVSGVIVEPFPDRPTEGFLAIHVTLSPMAAPDFEGSSRGRPSEESVEIGRLIERVVREARAIDLESLCLLAGRKVWSVRTEVHVLDHGGNITDAACLSAMAALLHFRRPEVTVSGDDIIVHPASERAPVPLSIHHVPISVSFAFFADGDLMVVDPTVKEEATMAGSLTMALNVHNEICCIQKVGGLPLSPEQIVRCSKIAAAKVAELSEILHTSLRQEAESSLPSPSRVIADKDLEEDTVSVEEDYIEGERTLAVGGDTIEPAETLFAGISSHWSDEEDGKGDLSTTPPRIVKGKRSHPSAAKKGKRKRKH